MAFDFNINGFLDTGISVAGVKPVGFREAKPGASPAIADPLRNAEGTPETLKSIGDSPRVDPLTLLGLQIDTQISDDFSGTVQLVADGKLNYKIEAEWAFLRYNISDNLYARLGRVRVPFYYFSESLQVGYTHPWTSLPEETYHQIEDSFSNGAGASLTYKADLMGYDFTASALYCTTRSSFDFGGEELSVKLDRIKSLVFTFGDDNFNIRVSYLKGDVNLESIPVSIAALTAYGNNNDENVRLLEIKDRVGYFWSLGYQFEKYNIYNIAEYTRKRVKGWQTDSYGWYFTLGYRINKWLPTVTVASTRVTDKHIFDGMNKNATTSPSIELEEFTINELIRVYHKDQDSLRFDLRYDLMPGIAIKGGVKLSKPKNGTAGLFNHAPQKSVKIYTLAINSVF